MSGVRRFLPPPCKWYARLAAATACCGATALLTVFLAARPTTAAAAYLQGPDSVFILADTNNNSTGTNNVYIGGNGKTSAAARMTVKDSGNVGIATTNPASRLQVNGNAAIGYSSSTVAPANGLAVSGSVGIGNTSPATKLHVTGGVRADSIGIGGAATYPLTVYASYQSNYVGFMQTDGTAQFTTVVANDGKIGMQTNNNLALVTNATARVLITAAGKVDIGGTTNPQALLTVTGNAAVGSALEGVGGPTNGLAVQGNVYIGQPTSPTERLEVNGNVKVKGKVIADSVRVQRVIVNNWVLDAPPDYVFDQNYKLRSLGDLEQYVKVNKHLPGVPSATEMKRNGLDLTEMNMTLLKKVEELTLHSIAQEKRIKSLETRLQSIAQ